MALREALTIAVIHQTNKSEKDPKNLPDEIEPSHPQNRLQRVEHLSALILANFDEP